MGSVYVSQSMVALIIKDTYGLGWCRIERDSIPPYYPEAHWMIKQGHKPLKNALVISVERVVPSGGSFCPWSCLLIESLQSIQLDCHCLRLSLVNEKFSLSTSSSEYVLGN